MCGNGVKEKHAKNDIEERKAESITVLENPDKSTKKDNDTKEGISNTLIQFSVKFVR